MNARVSAPFQCNNICAAMAENCKLTPLNFVFGFDLSPNSALMSNILFVNISKTKLLTNLILHRLLLVLLC